jgi:hypothetical protein
VRHQPAQRRAGDGQDAPNPGVGQRPGGNPLTAADRPRIQQTAQQVGKVTIGRRRVDLPHRSCEIAEVVVTQVGQTKVAKPWLEVKLDRLAVTGQGRRLDIGLGLPPAQPTRRSM